MDTDKSRYLLRKTHECVYVCVCEWLRIMSEIRITSKLRLYCQFTRADVMALKLLVYHFLTYVCVITVCLCTVYAMLCRTDVNL